MAGTIPEYVDPLLRKQQEAAGLLGINMLAVDAQTWRVNLTIMNFLGMILKSLNDKGVITDAEWVDALNATLTTNLGVWPEWMLQQYDPNNPPTPPTP